MPWISSRRKVGRAVCITAWSAAMAITWGSPAANGVWERAARRRTSTFGMGADGNVTKVMHDVKPASHADDVLAALG